MASNDLSTTRGNIAFREWASVGSPTGDGSTTLKIMTWNMLAQTLVRRDLFPTSDCLKSAQREGMLTKEILTYNADIVCLQEVDRLEKHLPRLRAASYAHTYAHGINKLHGCMILHKEDMFEKVAESTVYFDEVDVGQYFDPDPNRTPRTATTRLTKNIGLVVAFARRDESPGCIVVTTHAFWHPKFIYERTRQFGILLQTVRELRESDTRFRSWPAFLAGDFNTQPSEVAYFLLTGRTPSPSHYDSLETSRVIHISIDPTVTPSIDAQREDEGGTSGGDALADHPDRVIKDSRRATPQDRLLSNEEILQLYGGTCLRSAYDEALALVPSEHDNTFGAREPTAAAGRYEPMFTSFTYFWKLTLDYIFISDPLDTATRKPEVIGVLKGHRRDTMEPGLPKQGICGSDHVALMVEVI